jgi:hypothetical protein
VSLGGTGPTIPSGVPEKIKTTPGLCSAQHRKLYFGGGIFLVGWWAKRAGDPVIPSQSLRQSPPSGRDKKRDPVINVYVGADIGAPASITAPIENGTERDSDPSLGGVRKQHTDRSEGSRQQWGPTNTVPCRFPRCLWAREFPRETGGGAIFGASVLEVRRAGRECRVMSRAAPQRSQPGHVEGAGPRRPEENTCRTTKYDAVATKKTSG